MKTLGNIIWIIFGGWLIALSWLLLGCLLYITIIGIPFGKQCFKFAKLTLTPFGKDIICHFEAHPIANVLWVIFFGWEMACGYVTSGALACLTIVGIPFGLQAFKMAILALFPFGAEVKDH